MKKIKYGDSSYSLRLEMPQSWTCSAVKLAVYDTTGTNVLAAASATLYAGTTLNAAASVGDTSLTLAGTAAALASGDVVRIAAGTLGPYEDVYVGGYNSTTKVVTLLEPLRYDHANGAAVTGRWCTYSLDASSATYYQLGARILLSWQPQSTDDLNLEEEAIVTSAEFLSSSFWRDFETRFPAEWRIVEDRNLSSFEALLREDFRELFLSRSMDVDDVKDNRALQYPFALFARMVVLSSGGNEVAEQYDRARREFFETFETLCDNRQLWDDRDKDREMDDDEESDHAPNFDLRYL